MSDNDYGFYTLNVHDDLDYEYDEADLMDPHRPMFTIMHENILDNHDRSLLTTLKIAKARRGEPAPEVAVNGAANNEVLEQRIGFAENMELGNNGVDEPNGNGLNEEISAQDEIEPLPLQADNELPEEKGEVEELKEEILSPENEQNEQGAENVMMIQDAAVDNPLNFKGENGLPEEVPVPINGEQEANGTLETPKKGTGVGKTKRSMKNGKIAARTGKSNGRNGKSRTPQLKNGVASPTIKIKIHRQGNGKLACEVVDSPKKKKQTGTRKNGGGGVGNKKRENGFMDDKCPVLEKIAPLKFSDYNSEDSCDERSPPQLDRYDNY